MNTSPVQFNNNIDLTTSIKLLKKTQAKIFYYALGYQSKNLFLITKLPKVDFDVPIYAWFAHNKDGNWAIPSLVMTLWEKQAFKQAVEDMQAKTFNELSLGLNSCW